MCSTGRLHDVCLPTPLSLPYLSVICPSLLPPLSPPAPRSSHASTTRSGREAARRCRPRICVSRAARAGRGRARPVMCGIDDVSQCITPVYLSNEFLRKLLCTHPRLCVHNGISHSTHGVCNPFIPPRRMARCVLQRQWISHLHDLHPRRLRLQLRRLLLTTPVPSSDATLRRSSTRASSRALSNVSHARRVSALATISVTCVWSACLRARRARVVSAN